MKTKIIIVWLLLICGILSACGRNGQTAETNTVPRNTSYETTVSTMPTETSESTEETISNTESGEKEPQEDTVLTVDAITLAELKSFRGYIMLYQQGNVCYIYHIYCPQNSNYAYIECYETEQITPEFLEGETVAVTGAVSNIINYADYQIFNTRFYGLEREGSTISLEYMMQQWNDSSVQCIISGRTGQVLDLTGKTLGQSLDVAGDDKGLFFLIKVLYEDRGKWIQHFIGVEQS